MPSGFPYRALAAWYRGASRRLPWRKDPSPYKVWVSEIMLQQTRVQNVIPYFERFLKRFPDVRTLALAGEQDVVRLWSGLGYYSRVRNLRRAAKIVLERHGGVLPRNRAELLALPGIGPYSAGAILSIAYGIPEPIMDGNVRRVLSRFFLVRPDRLLWRQAGRLVAGCGSPSEFNQSLMELGALVCAPKQPACGACPLRRACRARKRGLTESYPRRGRPQKTVRRSYVLALLRRESRLRPGSRLLLLRRSGRRKWLKGLWEFPMARVPKGPESGGSRDGLERWSERFGRDLGTAVRLDSFLGRVRHAITRHLLTVQVFSGTASGEPARGRAQAAWASPRELERYGGSSLSRKALALLPPI
ncbi:MAG: A/G-specific adenine glycosylase [Elusimicrobia bacterium RIFCSPLOWO2_01_FULL_64_13]|nr:MAG: A/G-specific adenine glycosylase [Elusimicrobia bacterium RIFCSPHIGHO2_01_FULL_64_10]OGR95663.1 MAG: A/G-specific adenine glycosylase [Elusimicrobia bacterium RIFCSPLOWO2_01_FULL_64_13]